MTPAARLQAAIEILDLVIESARDNGPPADAIVSAYFKTRRYAGSKDRRAVRELVFRAIRRSAERPESGRASAIGLAQDEPELAALFGQPRGPEPLDDGETGAPASAVPEWLKAEMSPLVGEAEHAALLSRAPVDLRINVARTTREAILERFAEARPTPHSPWGVRLPPDSRVDDDPAYADGLFEVQDEGSQLIALACAGQPDETAIDLCAGGGGKSLAIAAAAPGIDLLAADTSKRRLSGLEPRAARAGLRIETRLLDMPREAEQLDDWNGRADMVLVDAPCSGSGTWRRNPEGRWRLTPRRLDEVIALQARILDIAAPLVRPGGRLVYAVCSILRREGDGQVEQFLDRHSSWVATDISNVSGRWTGAGRLLTPHHDGTDGFFVARLERSC